MLSRSHTNSWKVVAFSAVALCTTSLSAGPYDPAAQFSPAANPNGVWSYGYENFPLSNPFTLLTMALFKSRCTSVLVSPPVSIPSKTPWIA